MGQRPLYPPNVCGWKLNGYWVNASAMDRTAQMFASLMDTSGRCTAPNRCHHAA